MPGSLNAAYREKYAKERETDKLNKQNARWLKFFKSGNQFNNNKSRKNSSNVDVDATAHASNNTSIFSGQNPMEQKKILNATETGRIKDILLHDIKKLFEEKKDEFIRSINEDDFTKDVSIDYNLEKKIRSFITTQLQQKYNHSAEFIYCIINTIYVKEQHTFEPFNDNFNDNEYTQSNPCKETVNIFNFEDEKGKITGVLDLKPVKHSYEDTALHLLHLALLAKVRDIQEKFSSKILPPMMKSNNSSPTDVLSYTKHLYKSHHEELDKKTKELQKQMDESNRDVSKYIENIEKAKENDDDDIDLSELDEKLEDVGKQINNNTQGGIFAGNNEPTKDAVEKAKENHKRVMKELVPIATERLRNKANYSIVVKDVLHQKNRNLKTSVEEPIVNTNKNEEPVKFLDMWYNIENLYVQYPDIQDEIKPTVEEIQQRLKNEHNMNPLTQLMLFMHLDELFKDLTVSKALVEDIKYRIKTFKNVKPSKRSWLFNWAGYKKEIVGGKKTRKQRKRKTKKQKKKSNKKTKSRR